MEHTAVEPKKVVQAGRTPEESVAIMTELILPAQANLLGNLQGGQLMHYMDIAGALTCRRHSGHEVATVTVDKIEFRYPIHVGEVVTVTSKLVWVGHTSMKVRIVVGTEDFKTHQSKLTNTAYFTFVALGDGDRPVTVPPLLPQTEQEKKDFAHEQAKYEARKQKKTAAAAASAKQDA
ncbi:MAG: acyl-CoA thioesterase [Ethanoligenens sp.]|uniref:acyl-CoA thioesterase n=1 Tax=Ethanoligenens sp. TaxID=2099655 RepID=UPI0039ECBE8C